MNSEMYVKIDIAVKNIHAVKIRHKRKRYLFHMIHLLVDCAMSLNVIEYSSCLSNKIGFNPESHVNLTVVTHKWHQVSLKSFKTFKVLNRLYDLHEQTDRQWILHTPDVRPGGYDYWQKNCHRAFTIKSGLKL